MDSSGDYEVTLSVQGEESYVALNVLRVIVCVVGILGNLLVIFVILVLAEYKKSVTHWYVLQLAIADTIFLLTLPFRVVEDSEGAWNFPEWMCKAKETILFLNYYSSIMFLVVMSIDRYIAVCHSFSTALQKFRTTFAAAVITAAVWVVCLLICIPIMMYSKMRGQHPKCRCEYEFPKSFNATQTCLEEGERNATDLAKCVEDLVSIPEATCTNETSVTVSGSGLEAFVGLDGDFDHSYIWGSQETTASPEVEQNERTFLQPGCHYYNFAEGFKAFILFNFIVMFLVPLIIMAVCYCLIILRLYETRFRLDDGGSSDSKGSRPSSVSSGGKKRSRSTSSAQRNRNRIRVTVMCALMVILFVVCWLPFHSVHLAKFVGIQGTTKYCKDLFYAVALIAFVNSAINPYLYNFIGTRFGRRLRRLRESKAAKSFLSLASGVKRGTSRHSTSGGDHTHTNEASTKRKQKEQEFFELTSPDIVLDDEARAELMRKYPVYTGPTAQQHPPLENQSKNEPHHGQEQSNTSSDEQQKKELLSATQQQ